MPEHSELMQIFLAEKLISEKQIQHAERIRAKLGDSRPLLNILIELGDITEAQAWEAIRNNKLSMRIGLLLVELGLIRQQDLESAFAIQKTEGDNKKIGEILVKHNFIKEQKMLEVLSLQMGYIHIDPRFTRVDPALVQRVPQHIRNKSIFLPIRKEEGKVLVVFADPLDYKDIEDAEHTFQEGIITGIAAKDAIREVLQRIEKGKQGSIVADDKTTIGIIDGIIMQAIQVNASDIHIEPLDDRIRVRLRRDGVLELHKEYPLELMNGISSRIKIMSNVDITEKRRHQGGRLLFSYDSGQIDLRVSFYVTIHGEAIVLRLLNRQGALIDINDLGMQPRMCKRFMNNALSKPSGVLIITGPTGSGKTTTVYSCINYLNNINVSIITAEDPVEYVVPGVTQCSIEPKINLTYEETLRHIVRQDPDIIVIGEIRDSYTADVAVQAALTGHKVLTTFHTEDSIGGLVRLLNMDIEAFLISSTVVSVVAQRLLRQVCPECAKPVKPTQAELQLVGYSQKDIVGAQFMKGSGCPNCRYTGYNGRIAIFELLILDEYIRNAILDKQTSYEIRSLSLRTSGLVTLFEDGIVKAAQGITTIDEVLRCLPQVMRPRPLNELKKILGV